MDAWLFGRKYEFFEKTDNSKQTDDGYKQTQQKDQEPLMRKKLYQKIVFWYDKQ